MNSLEYFSFQLRRRLEAGEISPKETLDAIQQLVNYAARANEHDAEEGTQTREQREHAYVKREKLLSSSRECRALDRWQDAARLERIDAHVIQPEEYEDAPELTDAQLAAADIYEDGKRIRKPR